MNLLDDYPPDITFLRGKERCCKEGCRRNTESVVEMIYRDHGGKGGFTILMGKGIDKQEVDRITGRVHIAGSCAIQDYGVALQARLGKTQCYHESGMQRSGALHRLRPVQTHADSPGQLSQMIWQSDVYSKDKGSHHIYHGQSSRVHQANIVPLILNSRLNA